MYQEDVPTRAMCRLREWIRDRPQVTGSDAQSKRPAADMEVVALEETASSRLDQLYQRDAVAVRPNGHRTSSRPEPGQRSQPVHIQVRRPLQEGELHTSSLPAIPNPFPELCSQPCSPSLGNSSKPPASRSTLVITVFSEGGTRRSLEVGATATARDVCSMLVERGRCLDEESWALVEAHTDAALERYVEDHEPLADLQAAWPPNGGSKFIFRKHYAKYEVFRNPETFFPPHLLGGSLEGHAGISRVQLTQNFLNARSCPEIQGFLYLKEKGKRAWRRLYFFLRRSGFYYSAKGTSKEPRHLQYFADTNESHIYTVTNRKRYNSPTEFGFCVKVPGPRCDRGELCLLCADDEQTRTCWMTAFRLLKLGPQLRLNFQRTQQRESRRSWNGAAGSGGVSESCLVPMDFSGCTGRVIANPTEASMVAEEEAHAWRKKGSLRHSLPSTCPGTGLSTAIHRSQPWFHGQISREEAHRLIVQHGHIDGVFLMRESQRTPESFVLTLSHHNKTKHFLVAPCEEDGQMYFTVDTGQTKFSDLIQLVDFYQINRGVLPCSLKYYCTRVSL
ncbi:growth factor receptor-bound protein 7-like isoform X2 [Mobula hypostoma]|uniref:growth factor receptor-bound protein 7-like isoform X2 n=1 Tax=Mobula hypostoma TaxID=723540 RepID=UPI002FC361BB